MFEPKKAKYRKQHRNRGSLKGNATRGHRLSFGQYGLKAAERGEVSSRQLEAARQAMSRYIKRGGKIWIRIFPHQPITKKAAETPMGGGKGLVEKHVASIKPGTIIFEMDGVDMSAAKEAMRLAKHKLSIKSKFISKL